MRGLLALTVMAFCFTVHAQSCENYHVHVVDGKTGEALPGAHARGINRNFVASCDANGNVVLNLASADTLIFSFVGYDDQRVVPGPPCDIVVRLSASAHDLDEIVIKAERLIGEEFTYKKFRKLDIYTNPSAKADPILAVNSTPSATTVDESANISLRGGSPAETGIFLDNVPVNDAVRYSQLNGIGTFSIFNTALVNNVQVYPGNPPLEFGNTTSGLIALQTDEVIPAKPTSTLSVTLASFGIYTQQKLSDNSSITLFSNYQPSALLKAVNKEALKNILGFSSVDFGAHYFRKLDQRTTVKVLNGTWTFTTVFLFRQGSFFVPVSSATYDPALAVYVPEYGKAQRLPSYNTIDISISKLHMIQEKYAAVCFAGLGNIANFRNVRGYIYNFDYTQTQEDLFSQRTLYFGMIVTF